MVLAAALLVLVGVALFVGGLLTDSSAYYWLCVLACAAAGVLLALVRIQMGRPPRGEHDGAAASTAPPFGTAPPAGAAPTGHDRVSTGAGAPADRGGAGPEEPAPTGAPRLGDGDGMAVGPAGPPDGEPAPGAERVHRVPGPENLRGDPPVEEVEVTDLLLVVDLRDEVLVVDEHPRYHLPGCRWLKERATIPTPVNEARADGFTPCARCKPDRTLAERERGRRAGRTG